MRGGPCGTEEGEGGPCGTEEGWGGLESTFNLGLEAATGLFSVKVKGDCFSSHGLPRFPRSNAQMASPFPGGRDPR